MSEVSAHRGKPSAHTSLSIKVGAHLFPILIGAYFVSFLDRTNIAFAGPNGMNDELGISATLYGLAAGVFFIGYIFFEVPSNLALVRFGARRWITRIMASWGVVASAMAFAPNATTIIVLRVLLGVAESGLFAGVVLYLTYWFPEQKRARAVSWFMVALPLSSALGATMAGLIIEYWHDFLGLSGWRAMFLLEGLPSLVLAYVVFRRLPDGPRDATWLQVTEAAQIQANVDPHREGGKETRRSSARSALTDPVVVALCFLDFTIAYGLYALTFFLPTIVKGFESQYHATFSTVGTGAVTAIPYAIGAVTMLLWGHRTDGAKNQPLHVAIPLLVVAVCVPLTLYAPGPWTALLAVSGCAAGVYAAFPAFWTLPSKRLIGTAAATGFALITSVGNSAGFFAPYVTGWLTDWTGTERAGLWVTGAIAFVGAVLALVLRPHLRSAAQV